MQFVTFIAFILFSVAPLWLAFRYGDSLLDHIALKRRQSRRRARVRKTRSLPIQSDQADRLLGAEAKRDDLDERIADALRRFASLVPPSEIVGAESAIEQIERDILQRESRFNAFLDYAWLQSETLEILTEQARLLRNLADLPEEGLPVAPASEMPPPRARSASDKLFANLQDARSRREQVDQDLSQVGRSLDAPGSRFDATVGDDQPS